MSLKQFKLIVNKHLHNRKKHYIKTILLILSPVVILIPVPFMKSKIEGVHNSTSFSEIDPSYEEVDTGTRILYIRKYDPFYRDLMNKTRIKLQIPSEDVLGFNSEKSLLKYYHENHNYTIIAIFFKGSNHKKLDYDIRYYDNKFHEFLETKQLYSNKPFRANNSETDYYYKGVLSLQKSLDLSFIEQSSDNTVEESINISLPLRRFPSPPHNNHHNLLQEYLPLFILLSFTCLCFWTEGVEEKQSGIKELMKMVGLKPSIYWLGWFVNTMIPMIFAIFNMVVLLKITFFRYQSAIIEYTDCSILFCFLLLYCMAEILFYFAISTAFNKPAYVMIAVINIWRFSYFLPRYFFGLDEPVNQLSWLNNVLYMLFPNMGLHYGYAAIKSYEERELGVQWSNFIKPASDGSDVVTMSNVFVMLIIDIVLYWCLLIYFDAIYPGKYGVRKSFLFPFQDIKKIFSRRNDITSEFEGIHLEKVGESRECMDNMTGIKIQSLYKKFGKNMAVDNLNIDIRKNQTTILLGHNGAGKSTTMSMITGMLQPTSGNITFNGINIDSTDNSRKSIGICSQRNILFTDLTVKEHLVFFAQLKDVTVEEAEREAHSLLQKLNLCNYQNTLPHKLSPKLMRKVCLGMALIGGSKVLILDEPTAGLDSESRREIWDLLIEYKKGKTILMTTHLMEEAEVLGDWIAIMNNGQLRCYGTPKYLKNHYGSHYRLTLTLKNDSDTNKIANFIEAVENKISYEIDDHFVILIPFKSSINLPSILDSIEKEKTNLGIKNIAITTRTLEHVLRNETEFDSDNNNYDETIMPTYRTRDINKIRWKTLFYKRFRFFRKKLRHYVVLTIISTIIIGISINTSDNINNGPELKLQLDTYKETTVYYNATKEASELVKKYKQIIEEIGSKALKVDHVDNAILKKGMENILYYVQHIVASAEFIYNYTFVEAVALYNIMAIHSAPISLNLVTNTLAKFLLGDEYSISTANWPLHSVHSYIEFGSSSYWQYIIMWVIMIPLGCVCILASFIHFPQKEISSKFLQLQYMCGVSPFEYWLVNFFADIFIYLCTIIPLSIIICVFSAPFRGMYIWWILVSIFILYGMCGIPCAHLFSRTKTTSGALSTFMLVGFLGEGLAIILIFLMNMGDDYYKTIGEQLGTIIFIFIPHVNLIYTLFQFSQKAIENYNMQVFSERFQSLCKFNSSNPCCFDSEIKCALYKAYLPVIGTNLLLMFSSFLFYMLVSILLDTHALRKILFQLKWKILNIYYNTKNKTESRSRRYNIERKSENYRRNTMRVSKLQKTYSGKAVVNNVDLTLNKGDCLGILGVSGAGKTVTFQMLTREEIMDDGTVELKLDRQSIDINQNDYLANLGYCPQTDRLNKSYTGREILTIICSLRGVYNLNIVEQFLKCFDLEKYADIECGHYSNGNKRKLSLAVSLIGYPNIVLLDEPTNGVDPISKRKCWNLIKKVQKNKNVSFLLSSHSVKEHEVLSNNLKIMKNGKFCKEGSMKTLQNDFKGFSIKLILREKYGHQQNDCDTNSVPSCSGPSTSDSNELVFQDKESLKEYCNTIGQLRDEHSTLLHFYITNQNQTLKLIFQEMEKITRLNPDLVQDYTISESSLEYVYLEAAGSDEQ